MYPIGIIEDNEDLRLDFQAWFAVGKRDFVCVAAFSSVEKFQKYYDPDSKLRVLLLDINLPGMSGLDAIAQVKKILSPGTDIVMYSSFDDPSAVFKALCAGATGYLLKNQSFAKLEERLTELVEDGGVALSPSIARRIVQHFAKPQVHALPDDYDLKPIEREIVHYLVEGKTYPAIAKLLNLSVQGVKYHQNNIFKKMNVSSRNDITRIFSK